MAREEKLRVEVGMISFTEMKSWNIPELFFSEGLLSKFIQISWGTDIRKININLSSKQSSKT